MKKKDIKDMTNCLIGREPSISDTVIIYYGEYKNEIGEIVGGKLWEYYTVNIPQIGKVKVKYEDVFK